MRTTDMTSYHNFCFYNLGVTAVTAPQISVVVYRPFHRLVVK